MAILNKIRSKSIFLIIIIALALFAFIFSSILDSGGFNADKQNRVASINGVNLDREDFATKVEAQTRRAGANSSTTRAVNAVWEQEVNRVLLEEQYEELGIQVGKDRTQELLKQALQNDVRFQDADGFFSEAKMQEFIATLKDSQNPGDYQSWLVFEESLRNQEKQEIYYNLVRAGVGATLKDGEVAYKLDNNTVDIQYVQMLYTSVPDEEAPVSKDEIQEYVNDHKDEFQTEETRSIRFVKFVEEASLEDENALKAELSKLRNEYTARNGATGVTETFAGFDKTEEIEDFLIDNSDVPFVDRWFFKKDLPSTNADTLFALGKGGVYGPYKDGRYMNLSRVVDVRKMPDSVKTSHILIDFQGAVTNTARGPIPSSATRSKEDAKKLADSLLSVLKRNKNKFEDLAKEFSTDKSNSDNGGDLDYQNPNLFAAGYRDFIVDNNEGTIGIAETNFGYHVINIVDQKNVQDVIKVATVVKEILPSDKTISNIYNTTQKFELAAAEGDFQTVATENGYAVRPVQRIRAMDETLPGEGAQRSVIQWAFEEDTNVGDIKRFATNDGYIVAQVTRRTPAGTERVEDVSLQVTPIIRNMKKAEIIKNKISGSTLSEIAQSQGTTVKTAGAVSMNAPTIAGAGNEPKVVGAAFGLKEGEVSSPIEGSRGVYVIEVVKVSEAPGLENYAAFAGQQAQKSRAAVSTKVLNALKEAADIEDNRATFY
ncbi:peptidylprolyl isomerase [Dokdonia sp. MED134]|uniref:peptidylprolyl isomerase n=1 Tax=Dokdonia sp. MED134 TaxID=313590 RepID=UPI0000689EC8|nr:peptidylprolyl isomerase [Dokdonia sp. MED134]EAQ39122.1 peptidylprolyl isomerase [Dokdonia sp. MED134]